jgi:hypothetical protein
MNVLCCRVEATISTHETNIPWFILLLPTSLLLAAASPPPPKKSHSVILLVMQDKRSRMFIDICEKCKTGISV